MKPDYLIGHSIGEYVAACISGVLNLKDALKLVALRGKLMYTLPQDGDMAAIFADEQTVSRYIIDYTGDVSIAGMNDPKNTVISGKKDAVQEILKKVEADKIQFRLLKVSHAFHSPLMEPILSEFEKVAGEIEYNKPKIPLISNISGTLHQQAPDAAYWAQHIRQAVRFTQGIKTLDELGCSLFLEVGPHPALIGMGRNSVPSDNIFWLPSLNRKQKDWDVLTASLGQLYVNGFNFDWKEFDAGFNRNKLELPTYPFQRERFWADPINGHKQNIEPEEQIEEKPESAHRFNRDDFLTLSAEEQSKIIKEIILSEVSQVLRIPRNKIDLQKSFTQLGMDSIMAIELKNNIERALNIEIEISALLAGPNIDDLIQISLNAVFEEDTEEEIDPELEKKLSSLSHGQQAMWFQHQLSASSIYNLVYAVRVPTALDIEKLRIAMSIMVQRHEVLRTNFKTVEGKAQLIVHKEGPSIFEVSDTSDLDNSEFHTHLKTEINKTFDLEKEPLTQIKLFKRPDGSQVFLYVAHHIISDMWSFVIFMDELNKLYSASENPQLPEPSYTFAQFAKKMNRQLAGPFGEKHFKFWQDQLSGELPILNFPTDTPRPAIQTYQGQTETIKIDPAISGKLKKIAEENGTTLYTLLLAAFKVLLFRYSGQSDLIIGTPTTGRTKPEYAGILGYFVNPVAIRSNIEGENSFLNYLSAIKSTIVNALDHQDYPFNLLVEKIKPHRDPSRSPVFQMMFVYQRAHLLHDSGMTAASVSEGVGQMRLGDITMESIAIDDRVVPFDMTLLMAELETGMGASLQYNTGLFTRETAINFLNRFQFLLAQIVENPEQRINKINLLSKEEEKTITEWNKTDRVYSSVLPVHKIFENMARKHAEKRAVVYKGESLTYALLNQQANKIANALIANGVNVDSIVAISTERSLDMIVGVMGILKAGAGYLPLDPTYPLDRIKYMIKDSGTKLY